MTVKMKSRCRRASLAAMMSLALAAFGGAASWDSSARAAAKGDAPCEAPAAIKAMAPGAQNEAAGALAAAREVAPYAAEPAAA